LKRKYKSNSEVLQDKLIEVTKLIRNLRLDFLIRPFKGKKTEYYRENCKRIGTFDKDI